VKAWTSTPAMFLLFGSMPLLAAEASFEKTLTVPASGTVSLHVTTGSGYIHLSPGLDDKIHIVGHVRSTVFGEGDDAVQKIVSSPPVEVSGGDVRVGWRLHNVRNIVIDFEIQAPVRMSLDAFSASGSIDDDGVGLPAHLKTGSGDIRASALKGDFTLGTGSGNIYGEQAGLGDARVSTGSGSIELHNPAGTLRAQTGSGDIRLMGQPRGGWRVITGSGNVDVWPESASLSLEASTGSGSIRVDGSEVHISQSDDHSMSAIIRKGGPMVNVETGTGDIHFH
jgi:hypothetical protein